eukprot:1248631-Rhodomonas_salina.1
MPTLAAYVCGNTFLRYLLICASERGELTVWRGGAEAMERAGKEGGRGGEREAERARQVAPYGMPSSAIAYDTTAMAIGCRIVT